MTRYFLVALRPSLTPLTAFTLLFGMACLASVFKERSQGLEIGLALRPAKSLNA